VQAVADAYIDKYGIVAMSTGNPEFAAAAIHENGEILIAMTETDPAGSIIKVTGAVWISPKGESIVLYLREDGLPGRAIVMEHAIIFSNYTDTTVDIAIVAPDGKVGVTREVSITLDEIIKKQGGVVPVRGARGLAKLVRKNDSLSRDEALEMATIAFGVFSCAATFGSGGALSLAFGVGCASAIYHVWKARQPEKNVALEGASLGGSGIACGAGLIKREPATIGDCGAALAQLAEVITEEADDTKQELNTGIEQAESSLASSTGDSTDEVSESTEVSAPDVDFHIDIPATFEELGHRTCQQWDGFNKYETLELRSCRIGYWGRKREGAKRYSGNILIDVYPLSDLRELNLDTLKEIEDFLFTLHTKDVSVFKSEQLRVSGIPAISSYYTDLVDKQSNRSYNIGRRLTVIRDELVWQVHVQTRARPDEAQDFIADPDSFNVSEYMYEWSDMNSVFLTFELR
jgi:hypothetical protein